MTTARKTMQLPVAITADERAQLAKEMAEYVAEARNVEDQIFQEKEDHKNRIKALKKQLDDARAAAASRCDAVQNGTVSRDVRVDVHVDFARKQTLVSRCDTGEVVEDRAASAAELTDASQPVLFEERSEG